MRKAKITYHHGDLRNALITEAARTIQARGNVEFTIRDLAGALKVTHTAAYRHFANKTAILAAVAYRGFELLRANLAAIDSDSTLAPREKLNDQGVAYVVFAVQNPGYFRAMFHADLRDKKTLPELAVAAQAAYDCLARAVVACQQQKLFKGHRADLVTLKAWAVVHGLAFLTLDGQLPDVLTGGRDTASSSTLAAMVAAVLASAP